MPLLFSSVALSYTYRYVFIQQVFDPFFCQRIIFLSTKSIYYWCIESKFDTYSKDISTNDAVDMGFISRRYYMLFRLYRIHYQEFSDHLCGKTKWSTEMGNGLRGGLSNNKKEKEEK